VLPGDIVVAVDRRAVESVPRLLSGLDDYVGRTAFGSRSFAATRSAT